MLQTINFFKIPLQNQLKNFKILNFDDYWEFLSHYLSKNNLTEKFSNVLDKFKNQYLRQKPLYFYVKKNFSYFWMIIENRSLHQHHA